MKEDSQNKQSKSYRYKRHNNKTPTSVTNGDRADLNPSANPTAPAGARTRVASNKTPHLSAPITNPPSEVRATTRDNLRPTFQTAPGVTRATSRKVGVLRSSSFKGARDKRAR